MSKEIDDDDWYNEADNAYNLAGMVWFVTHVDVKQLYGWIDNVKEGGWWSIMNLLSILFIYMPANNKGLKRGLLGVLFAGVAGVVAAMFLSDQKNRKVIVDKAKKVGKATKKATKKVKSGVVKQAKKISKKISKK
jgi:hypothetical protein